MSGAVLLTGATGFLGTQIARRLVRDTDRTVVTLVRGDDQLDAKLRLSRAWWEWPELVDSIGSRVEALGGDVALPRLGLGNADYARLVSSLTHIIHAAADLRIDSPVEELRKTNVGGAVNVLELARAAHIDHGLSRLSHVSTAYVAGRQKGDVPEEALAHESGFFNAYEQSKHEGELLVQAAKRELPVSVFRPGMIVGDSRTGAVKTFNTVYYPLRLYLTGETRALPIGLSLRVNLVPVDYVADTIARLTFEPRAEGLNFHVTAPYESLPTAGELMRFVQKWAEAHLGLRLPRLLFLPLPPSLMRGRTRNRGSLALLAPYFQGRLRFRRDNVDLLLGHYALNWREVLPPILEYAVRMGFMHRSERTVHEQVLYRLQSRSRPVTYYDVVDSKIMPRSAADVRDEMLRAAASLRALGIGQGDRVAIVGLNSTRYLSLDVAIGLVGAMSVPLYYTSPPAEVDSILESSGARLLLVGAPRLLERLGELSTKIALVSFCRGSPPESLPRRVKTWEEFLALGAGSEAPATAPIGFEDLATIRYTSGTTGSPKGVTFRHGNLRWMAESMTSLLPWKTRIRDAFYLSFLPMNHVVEGILGTYSPYYVPAPLNIYFLEDFRELQRALPRVRPTIFFSVPRFYEKLWEALMESRVGGLYSRSRRGFVKWALQRLIRRQLLRKAGLDRCDQLIVGSAPVSEDLLRNLQGLGVEVHNAYGLTEAPLVTLNRKGSNRVGTVGEPLPETEVKLSEEGEVMVRGPQVTQGYFGKGAEQPFLDGWLLTGDVGCLTDEGYLVIQGRKKELIATSYGKKVHPGKVEGMLKEIPKIAEAMLVGEGRPYCTALLWIEGDRLEEAEAKVIDQAVEGVNARLSNPEQVKRWAVLPNDLSIEGGDLTANLKLKREPVARRRALVVEALYNGEKPSGALHIGEAGKRT